MKNTKIIILITTFILLCGCVNKDENKLVKYLKSINYDCLKNVCVYEPSDGNVKVKSVYDIDNTLYKKENNYSQIQSSFLEYNWATNEVKYDYKVLTEEFNVNYNLDTKEFDCKSESDNETFKIAECKHLKEDIEDEIENFNKIIEASGEKIK